MLIKRLVQHFVLLAMLWGAQLASAQELPIDTQASSETVQLYRNLKLVMKKGVLFGHQDDLAYGVNWKYEKGRSDVKESCGDYPAVYGWELGRIELDHSANLDGVPFDKMKEFIRQAYDRGAVITISWHLNNPLTLKSAWDPAPGTVASVLPGGAKHELYLSWLDKVASFLSDLKGKKGEMIPIIFRPFHELNGSWFWWGKNHCSAEEIKSLYQLTVKYLRDTKNCHHLLYAFNTDRFQDEKEYLERYPGDEWVDVIGFDIYQRNANHQQFISDIGTMVKTISLIASNRKKIPAITEFGYNELPEPGWWTNVFWEGIKSAPIAFALAWRNAGKKQDGTIEYYVPFASQASQKNFKEFYKLPGSLFNKDAAKLKLYKKNN